MQVCGWRWGSQSALEAQLGMLAQAASVLGTMSKTREKKEFKSSKGK